jgi:hypothetical protein
MLCTRVIELFPGRGMIGTFVLASYQCLYEYDAGYMVRAMSLTMHIATGDRSVLVWETNGKKS